MSFLLKTNDEKYLGNPSNLIIRKILYRIKSKNEQTTNIKNENNITLVISKMALSFAR